MPIKPLFVYCYWCCCLSPSNSVCALRETKHAAYPIPSSSSSSFSLIKKRRTVKHHHHHHTWSEEDEKQSVLVFLKTKTTGAAPPSLSLSVSLCVVRGTQVFWERPGRVFKQCTLRFSCLQGVPMLSFRWSHTRPSLPLLLFCVYKLHFLRVCFFLSAHTFD